MNKDTVVGILGAVILVAAMVAIFYYEGTQAPGATGTPGGNGGQGGTGLYSLANGTGPALDGVAIEGGEAEEQTVTLNQTNLAAVEFVLSWTDDIPGQNGPNDNFELTITGPGGQAYPAESGTGGELVVRVPLNQAPTARGVTVSNGTGAWRVSVALTNAGDGAPVDQPVPTPVPIPGVTDTGNSWDLAVRYSYYRPN